ncbi:unnamed protein product [Acanthoscelides obtectus]|uniref:Uncharacterized protein n=1 Tax=Acanthoscelides obtectus TaxID=200917 RepID=A0A9P0LT10_ACAOB|nr:unnamed protein product [Acanthoscelides obtectus]CAK1643789.1 hypothetical protein AOBTE_LOCUS13674 [Acanthoscelides obtectus]
MFLLLQHAYHLDPDRLHQHRTMHYNTQEQSPQPYIQGFGISTLTNDMNHLQQLPYMRLHVKILVYLI